MDKLQVLVKVLDRVAGEGLGRLARWKGVLIFNYHRVGRLSGEMPFDHDVYSATQEGFAEQMAFLKRYFDVVGPAELDRVSREPAGRTVMVTFDDGYRDNFELAFPVLRDQKVPATFFITTSFLDEGVLAWWDEIAWMIRRSTVSVLPAGPWTAEPLSLAAGEKAGTIKALLRTYKRLRGVHCAAYMTWLAQATGSGRCPPEEARKVWMTWDMVREMRHGGMAIGGHTVNHPVLSRLSAAEQAAEIQGCAQRLRDELGEPMRWFAYPVGARDAFNADTRQALADVGVEFAFSYYGGYNRPGTWDRTDMRRIAVEHMHDSARFRATAALPSLYGSHDEPMGRRLRKTLAEFLG